MFKHIIDLFKFSKLEVMGGQFFQWQFAGAAGLEQHTSGIGID
ncbi:hypothetical protein [Acinetobacter variabilis]